MTEGKRKEDRAGGRICWSKHQGLGKPNLERGFWGPAGPPRLEEPLYHPGSPCSLSWVPRPQQPRAWVLLGQQAAQSPASSLRPPPTPPPPAAEALHFPLSHHLARGHTGQKQEQARGASPRDRKQILHPPARPCPSPSGHACLLVQVQLKQMLCA